MTIPDFKFYNHSISQVLANDQKAHLSLRKIASAVKSDRNIFRTLAEPLIDLCFWLCSFKFELLGTKAVIAREKVVILQILFEK